MAKVQSTPPFPEPMESCSVVISAVCKSENVSPGMKKPPDQTAESTATLTEWLSLRSTSEKLSVPVGSGLVVSSELDPLTPGCSATEADPGPLVIAVASLAPVTVTVTVCVEVVEASLTATL